jgi:hypothetical protein
MTKRDDLLLALRDYEAVLRRSARLSSTIELDRREAVQLRREISIRMGRSALREEARSNMVQTKLLSKPLFEDALHSCLPSGVLADRHCRQHRSGLQTFDRTRTGGKSGVHHLGAKHSRLLTVVLKPVAEMSRQH